MTNPSSEALIEGVPWQIVGRPGFAGHRRDELARRRDARWGADRWRIAYLWEGRVIGRDAALALYEDAYVEHLRAHPAVLDWLCRAASDVYDTATSNVRSGVDYHAQEGGPTRLQDVAIRRALGRLGRRFQGEQLLQVRGRQSPGYVLNPGRVAFHLPGRIVQPGLPGWWDRGSIEEFWQSNKVLVARADDPLALRAELIRPLPPAGRERRVALFGGSFNPIHLGHLRIAQDLVELHGFEKVVFVPNGDWYRKRDLAQAADRLVMVGLAIAGEPRFVVSDHEVAAAAQVLVPDSVARVHALVGPAELFVVRGSDAIPRMLRWASFPAIAGAARLLVVERPGAPAFETFGDDLRFRLSSDRFAVVSRGWEDGLSSTLVRARVAAGGSARFLVPDPVAAYVADRGLYAARRR
jgi:nicotinate-nucleotide adenylyltransferase